MKIQRESVNQACLIAPAWPGQTWYSQLLTMLAGYLILLPQSPKLVLSPDQSSPVAARGIVPDCMACLRQSYKM